VSLYHNFSYVFTWRDGEQRFYVDGVEALSGEVTASAADTELFAIGWLWGNSEKQWGGPLANLITFDRPLSSNEVAALHRMDLSTR